MPVADIVRLARSHGIISVIDGAHPPGLMPVDMSAIDPDFYASSPHKWLLAPQGTGFLYMRENWRRKLWVTLASGGWDDLDLGAQRFNHLGTFDESRMAGLLAALRFHQALGPDRAYARARSLRERLYDALTQVRGVHRMSTRDPSLVAGMVSFKVDGIDALELQRRLARRPEKVRTRVISEFDLGWMRLSPHIYNSPEEVDRIVELIGEEARRA
jgi:isopenicillin-N epimerase